MVEKKNDPPLYSEHEVDSREHAYRLPSLFSTDQSLKYVVLETGHCPVGIRWQRQEFWDHRPSRTRVGVERSLL